MHRSQYTPTTQSALAHLPASDRPLSGKAALPRLRIAAPSSPQLRSASSSTRQPRDQRTTRTLPATLPAIGATEIPAAIRIAPSDCAAVGHPLAHSLALDKC